MFFFQFNHTNRIHRILNELGHTLTIANSKFPHISTTCRDARDPSLQSFVPDYASSPKISPQSSNPINYSSGNTARMWTKMGVRPLWPESEAIGVKLKTTVKSNPDVISSLDGPDETRQAPWSYCVSLSCVLQVVNPVIYITVRLLLYRLAPMPNWASIICARTMSPIYWIQNWIYSLVGKNPKYKKSLYCPSIYY